MIEDTLQPFMAFIQDHPTWTGVIVCIISISESLVGIGFFVPGVLLMTSIGALVGNGTLPLFETLFWAILGAVIGDGVSFWVGYRYKEHLSDYWPFSRYPQWLIRGKAFFQKHGGTSIILGRFIGPIRPIIPVIAGMMDMKPLHFYSFNIASAIVWAPLYSLPGYLFGLTVGLLDAKVSRRLVLIIILAALALWAVHFALKYCFVKLSDLCDKALNGFYSRLHHVSHMGHCLDLIKDKRFPEARGQLGKLFFFGLFLSCALMLHWDVQAGAWIETDQAFWQICESLHFSPLATFAQTMGQLGSTVLLLRVFAILGCCFILYRQKWSASFLLLAMLLGVILQALLSFCFNQDFWSTQPLWATVLLGSFASRIASDLYPKFTWVAFSTAIILILTISFSQLYLGALVLSQAIVGILYAFSIILFLELIYRSLNSDPWYGKHPRALGILSATIIISGFIASSNMIILTDKHIGQIPPNREITWQSWSHGMIDDFSLRHNFWGKALTDFNVAFAVPEEEITAVLKKQGWLVLENTNFLTVLQWLSNAPKPEEHPDIPHFNKNKTTSLIMVKPTPFGRYALRLWSTNSFLDNKKKILIGTVLAQEWRQLPLFYLVHLYRANANYAAALDQIKQDLLTADPNLKLTVNEVQRPRKAPEAAELGWDFRFLLID
jgi:membrane protein DedA with SNARE-associated domain